MANQKSQIAQAITLELVTKFLVATHIAQNAELLTYDYVENLRDALSQMRSSHPDDHEERLAEVNLRAQRLTPLLLAILEEREQHLGARRSVIWTGRDRSLDTSVADLIVVHDRGATEFSIKSTSTGSGTSRNLGMTTLSELVPDLKTRIYEPMLHHVVANLSVSAHRRQQLITQKGKFNRKLMTDDEKDEAKALGEPFLTTLLNSLVDTFNALPIEEKRKHLNVWDARGKHPGLLFLAVVTESSEEVKAVYGPTTAQHIHVETFSDTGFRLFEDGTEILTGQVSCTNGIGISAMCVRTFSAVRSNLTPSETKDSDQDALFTSLGPEN